MSNRHFCQRIAAVCGLLILSTAVLSCEKVYENPPPMTEPPVHEDTTAAPETEPVTVHVTKPVTAPPDVAPNKRPALLAEPVTTTTETITLYLYNGTGETICTRTKAKEIQEVYQIEKLVDGEWQRIGSRMDELAGGSFTYKVTEEQSLIDHEPGSTTVYTIPVKAWCGGLLAPGSYRVPVKYGTFFDPEEYADAWYFTVSEAVPERTDIPADARPTLTMDPVTTATETIALYLHNSTGGDLMTRTKSKEILEVYQIEKLVDGEWQRIGSRMYELAGGSPTYKVHEIEVHTPHAPEKTVAFTVPVKAWCDALLTPGEYRIPVEYGYVLNEGFDHLTEADIEWYDDAWYFTVTE